MAEERINGNEWLSRTKLWLLMAMAFIFPFKFKVLILLATVYFVLWALGFNSKRFLKDLSGNKTALCMILFYLLHVFGMLWTSNAENGFFDLQVKFSLLVLPLILTDTQFNTSERIQQILKWFVYGCLTAIAIDLVYALVIDDKNGFYYSSLSKFLHPGYFSLYLCFAAVVLYNDLLTDKDNRIFSVTFSMISFILIGIGILLLSSKFGILTLIAISIYFGWKGFGNKLVRKFTLTLSVLTVLAVVISFSMPFMHNRMAEMKNISNNDSPKGSVSSSVMRLQVWKTAMTIIGEHPVLGTGTGDIKDMLISLYKERGYEYVAEVRLNAHNQFLQSFATLGILGILLYIGIFVYGLIHAIKSKNRLLVWLLLIIVAFSFVESVLEVQAGVMFFTFFIPLLYNFRHVPVNLESEAVLEENLFVRIKKYAVLHPLRFALISGFILRFVAAIFSKGFGMHDDHFLVIEASGAWADGTDYDSWLPSHGGVKPDGHSFFYSGLHFLFFVFLKWIGVLDPQLKMFFVRLVHAVLSLVTIYFGFKIANKLHNIKSAALVAFLLAVLWFMPWLSVRNLVEVACIPFLVWGSWLMLDADSRQKPWKYFVYAGMLFGVAYSIRFQTVLFIGGAGLALLFQKRIIDAIALGIGTLAVFVLTQAPVDYLIWGAPFAQFGEYVNYNLENAYNYIVGPWYNYTLLILGILIPPISIFMFFGWMRQWKKQLLLFLPVLVFLAFHSYFPNKQERFILPMVPFFVIMGIPGWNLWKEARQPGRFLVSFEKYAWVFFWTINILLLPFITTMYSKKARVESMTYLYPVRSTISSVIMEDTNRGSAKMAPEFYLGKWIYTYELSQQFGYDSLEFYMHKYGPRLYPQYILFLGDKNLEERVAHLQVYFPKMEPEATIEPGFVDRVLYWLNPRNANDVIYIYKTGIPPARPPD